MKKINYKNAQSTFTKKWVAIILIISFIDIQFSYILAYLGKTEAAITLSISIVTEIVGVMTGYFMKAYYETKQQKLQEWKKEQYLINMSYQDDNNEIHNKDSDSVG